MKEQIDLLEAAGAEAFERIRDLPYRVSEYPGDPATNCIGKGKMLLETLGIMGFSVRGCVAEMDWHDTKLPKDIIALYPQDLLATHFYIEIKRGDVWHALDASWDKGLEKAGFPIATFDGRNSPAFPLKRVYTHRDQVSYIQEWREEATMDDYFHRAGPFLKAANAWFEKVRAA